MAEKIIQFQGHNNNWFIKVDGILICGSCSKEWSDKFLDLIKKEIKDGKN